MYEAPIGIFDSGLGGLTALAALRRLLPDEDIVYFGDTGRAPYGVRSVEQLRRMARQDMDFAAAHGAKAMLAACGTVSSTAPDILDAYPVPVFGVLRSAVRAMGKIPGGTPLAVIATDASTRSGVFKREIEKLCPGREVMSLACQDFVRLVESGHTSRTDADLQRSVEESLRPVKERGCAALLLACTHFGLINAAISDYLGADVQLVSAADCAAAELATYLTQNGLTGGEGKERYFTSGSAAVFTAAAATFLGRELPAPVEHVAPMEV